jgi:tetratricopeptide (TPR) repeat protein
MISPPKIPVRKMRLAAAVFLISAFLTESQVFSQSTQPNHPTSFERSKRIAETQHEIVMLLIKKKEYGKAVAEAGKIFEMRWPENQEPLLLGELLFLSDQFLRNGQPTHGLQLLQKSSKLFKKTQSQIKLLKEQGYLYKCMGQHDKALDCFREAKKMEDKT